MNRSSHIMVLAFAGLTLVLAVVAAVYDWRLALGAAAVAGGCAVWAALMSTVRGEPVEVAVADGGNETDAHSMSAEECAAVAVAVVREAGLCAPPTSSAVRLGSSEAPAVVSAPVAMEAGASAESGAPIPVAPVAEAPIAPVAEECDRLSPSDIELPDDMEPASVLEALLSSARAAGTAVGAHLWLEDVGTPTLRLIRAAGAAHPDPTPVSATQGALGSALANRVDFCDRVAEIPLEGMAGAGWRYAIPLEAGAASGVAAVDFLGEASPDLLGMAQVASALRGSLTGALALHVARAEAHAARELLDTATDLSRLIDPDDVVASALRHALELSGAETGSVMLLDQDGVGMRIAKAQGLPSDVVEATLVLEGEGIAGWVLASGRPLVVEDLEHRGPQSRRHGVLSAVSVPIADESGVLGVLNVGSRRFHPRFSRPHVRSLETIGRTTAIALRNALAVRTSQDLYFDTLKALALALETRDPYARGGTDRVVDLVVRMSDALELGETQAHALKLAALLHDIGMSAAGDAVAVTSRPLTTVEWGMLKMHPHIAAEILSEAPALRAVIPIVFHHHERFDGGGYGAGLAGEDIPLGARVLSVCDAYVAMTSDRPYRSAMSQEEALAELTANAGTQFDSSIVGALVELVGGDSAVASASSGRSDSRCGADSSAVVA